MRRMGIGGSLVMAPMVLLVFLIVGPLLFAALLDTLLWFLREAFWYIVGCVGLFIAYKYARSRL
jgi:hypothetical protein